MGESRNQTGLPIFVGCALVLLLFAENIFRRCYTVWHSSTTMSICIHFFPKISAAQSSHPSVLNVPSIRFVIEHVDVIVMETVVLKTNSPLPFAAHSHYN